MTQTEEEIKQAAEAIKRQTAQQPISGTQPIPWFMSSLVRDKQEVSEKIDKPEVGEDKVLADLAGTDAWRFLRRFIKGRQVLFKELLKDKIAQSPYDMQEIGFRYVVSAQVEDVLQEIINRVENFAKFVDKPQDQPGAEKQDNES